MSIFDSLGLLAGLVQIVGYVWYVSYVVRGVIKPNTSSWVIWTYGNVLVCWSYIASSEALTLKETLPLVCSIAGVISSLIFLALKKFKWPEKRYEWGILIADILITIYWVVTGETQITQILLQVSVFLSFIPIVKDTREHPKQERPGPWFIWSVAYLLLFFAQSSQDFWMWIYPLQYLIWHFVMGMISAKPRPSLT